MRLMTELKTKLYWGGAVHAAVPDNHDGPVKHVLDATVSDVHR